MGRGSISPLTAVRRRGKSGPVKRTMKMQALRYPAEEADANAEPPNTLISPEGKGKHPFSAMTEP
jgi:hypothetical protein